MKTATKKSKVLSNNESDGNDVDSCEDNFEKNSEPFDISLDNAIEQFILDKDIANVSENTLEIYHYVFKNLKSFLNEGINISSINKPNLRQFFVHLNNKELKSSTRQIHYRTLNTLFNWLKDEEYIENNPLNNISKPKTPDKYPKHLTEDQATKLLKTAKKGSNTWTGFRNYTIIKCFLGMGLRREELIEAKIDNYDPGKSSLKVIGKGKKSRIVACTKDLNKTIRKWIKKRGELEEIYDDTIFISRNGDKLKGRNLNENITRIQEKAGLEDVQVSPHVLRHTSATQAAKEGMGDYLLKRFYGWEQSKTAERYIHASGRDARKAIAECDPLENLN